MWIMRIILAAFKPREMFGGISTVEVFVVHQEQKISTFDDGRLLAERQHTLERLGFLFGIENGEEQDKTTTEDY